MLSGVSGTPLHGTPPHGITPHGSHAHDLVNNVWSFEINTYYER